MFRRFGKVIIAAVFLLGAWAGYLATKSEFDYNFDRFFPENDPEWVEFKKHREAFGSDNDFVLIGLKNESGIFDKKFAAEIDKVTKGLRKVPYVQKVISPLTIRRNYNNPLLPVSQNAWRWKDESKFEEDSIAIWQAPDLYDNWFSKDGKSVSIIALTQNFLVKEQCDTILTALDPLLAEINADEIHVTGKALFQRAYIRILERELPLLLGICAILVLGFLFYTFRDIHGVLAPILVIGLSVLFTIALIQIANKPMDVMTVLLPVMIFIVGTSDVVHMYSKYKEERQKGFQNRESVIKMVREIGLATFLTSVTTSIGFGTLTFSNIRPVKEFGYFAATGVMIAFAVTLVLLPSILIHFPLKNVGEKRSTRRWDQLLRRMFVFSIRKSGIIAAATAVLLILSALGIYQLKLNSKLLEDLPEDSDQKMAFAFFENNFSGVRSFELRLTAGENSGGLLDKETVLELNKIEDYLRNEYGVGGIRSPLSSMKLRHLDNLETEGMGYTLPADSELSGFISSTKREMKSGLLDDVLSEDGKSGRLYGRIPDAGSYDVDKRNVAFDKFLQEKVDDGLIQVAVTGTGHLMDKNNRSLATGIVGGLLIALFVIAILAAFVFRSGRMVPASLLPNIIPLLVIAAIIGWASLDLKISNTIIFTIAFGICVDDTIHFLGRYLIEKRKGRTTLYALKRSYLSTGKAIVLTSIILCSGFAALSASEFVSTSNMGILISLCLVVALSCDLLLIPGLILFFSKKDPVVQNLEASGFAPERRSHLVHTDAL